jgi:antitoxin MazE
MTAKISKWGNSQGLRVPKDVMENLHLHVGDSVNIIIEDGKAILEPIKKEIPKYDLNELISNIPKEYKTKEEFNEKIGKEEW